MCARFGFAMHCEFPKEPILNCEPAACREANGIEQSSRRCRLFSSHVSVTPVTIRAPALGPLPFERRLRTKGGPPLTVSFLIPLASRMYTFNNDHAEHGAGEKKLRY